jgi:diguanylate cyclase (GGDEF)-like protein
LLDSVETPVASSRLSGTRAASRWVRLLPGSRLARLMGAAAILSLAPAAAAAALGAGLFGPNRLAPTSATIVAVANILGTGIAALCIRASLRPLRRSVKALRDYARYGRLPDLRIDPRDDIGRLMSEIRQIIVDSEQAHAELLRDAETDPLTALANRRKFLWHGAQDLREARRRGEPLAVILLDIDRFKAVNDSFGHAAGDAVLRLVAGAVARGLRDGDALARLGGEEFAILLPRTPLPDALRLAETLRATIAALPMPALDGATVTASFGVTVHDQSDGHFEVLLERADRALYDAKRAGRDRIAYRLAIDEADDMTPPELAQTGETARPARVWLVD